MAPPQEHPAKYFSAHICPRPFWNPLKFQQYFKNSHHRQPPQILIDITCVFHIHFDSSLAQFGFCSPLIYDDRYVGSQASLAIPANLASLAASAQV